MFNSLSNLINECSIIRLQAEVAAKSLWLLTRRLVVQAFFSRLFLFFFLAIINLIKSNIFLIGLTLTMLLLWSSLWKLFYYLHLLNSELPPTSATAAHWILPFIEFENFARLHPYHGFTQPYKDHRKMRFN